MNRKGFKYLLLFGCLCIALGAFAACKQHSSNLSKQIVKGNTEALSANSKTYLALGDSYTIGQSISASGRYPAQIADILAGKGINISHVEYLATTGWTTQDLQDAINETHINGTFDFVTLLIGVNDQYQGVTKSDYSKRFTKLLQQAVMFADYNKQHVIVISVPDYGVTPFGNNDDNISAQIDAFNVINKQITDAQGIAYVDVTALSKAVATDNSLLASDGLHYSQKEYRLWAEKIAPLMYRTLEPGK